MVTFHTNYGHIVIKTFTDNTPITVENFLNYCQASFYDNTIFHRFINDFIVHCSDFEPSINQKSTQALINNATNNGLKNTISTLTIVSTTIYTLLPCSFSSTWQITTF